MSFWSPVTVAAVAVSVTLLAGCGLSTSGTTTPEPAPRAPVALNSLPGLSVAELKIPGLGSDAEVEQVETALEPVPGYKGLKADLERQTVKVVFDPEGTTPDKLVKALTSRTTFKASIQHRPEELDLGGGTPVGEGASSSVPTETPGPVDAANKPFNREGAGS